MDTNEVLVKEFMFKALKLNGLFVSTAQFVQRLCIRKVGAFVAGSYFA